MIENYGRNLTRAMVQARGGVVPPAEADGVQPITTAWELGRVLDNVPGDTAVGPFAVVEYSPSDKRLNLHPPVEPEADHGGVTVVRVYGANDDLIEVEGGTLTKEWSAPEGWAYVLASTGDVLRFRLESEGWRAQIVHNVTDPVIGKRPKRDADDEDDDLVTIAGPVHWITATTAPVVRA